MPHSSAHRFRLALGLAALAILLAATACATAATRSGYPPSVRASFTNYCVAGGGDRAGRACALERLEREYTLEEFMAIDRLAYTGYMSPAVERIIVDCLG